MRAAERAAACLLALAACAAHAAPQRFEDTMAQRMLACTGCHGKEGRAGSDGYYPRIAGKPAGYLYRQLVNFRDGRRRYAPMTALLDPLSDAYLREIAEHFAALEIPYPPPQPPAAAAAVLERGRQLASRGDAARRVPACAACHGERLTGVAPSIPGLLGLPRDYLNGQLGAWRSSARHAQAPDCMAEVARRLAPADVAALSQWLATQPVPRPSAPAASLPAEPPLDCGSLRAATPPGAAAPAASAQVARGAYLARAGDCAGCHTARGGASYAGGRAIETPFGTVVASNLTPDSQTGLGRWSADDFWRALHDGRSRDGRLLVPAFPYPNYTLVSRDDADALYAWLRSLPAVEQPNRPHALRFPYGTQAALAAWRLLYFAPQRFVPDPARPAEWNRGAYLVQGLGHCSACHASRNALGATAGPLDLGGGLIPVQNWYAPSLAAPHEAGVQQRDAAQVVQLLKSGIAGGASMAGPMADVVAGSTQHLADADLRAIAAYLRALPVEPPPPQAPPPRADPRVIDHGATVYDRHCAQCHGEHGEGVGAYPPLAGNRAARLDTPANLVNAVLQGGFAPATAGNPRPFGMPPFAPLLADDDIAAVLSFIRASWGNRAAPVTPYDVQRFRARGP